MTIYSSSVVQDSTNTRYGSALKITDNDSLLNATSTDWTPHKFKDNVRNSLNWLGTDCLVLDIDKDMTIIEFQNKFKRYKFYIVTSRNHQKDKHGHIEDRFHALFPIDLITNESEYKTTLNKLLSITEKADGACSDTGRFFFGVPKPDVVYQSSGKHYITSHPSFNKPERELGKIIRVMADPGVGKSQISIHISKDETCKIKFAAPTWISARNINCKTIQSTLKHTKSLNGSRQKFDCIFIDEASMVSAKFVVELRKNNPYKHIVLVGDPNQMILNNDNALTNLVHYDKTIWLKNKTTCRIQDPALQQIIDYTKSNQIIPMMDFAMQKTVKRATCPIVGLTNKAAKITNDKYELGTKDTFLKSKFNDTYTNTFGTYVFSNNEMFLSHGQDPTNDQVLILERLSNKEIIKISKTFLTEKFNNFYEPVPQPRFVVAQQNTLHSVQGQTLDKICIDLASLIQFNKKTNEHFVVKDTINRFFLTATSRVRKAEDVTFMGTEKLLPLLAFDDDWRSYEKKQEDEEYDINELLKLSGKEVVTLFLTTYTTTPVTKKAVPTWSGAIRESDNTKEEETWTQEQLDFKDHAENNRNIFFYWFCWRLKKKAKKEVSKGYSFNVDLCFELAQSVVGCDEIEYKRFKRRYKSGKEFLVP